MSKAPSKLGLKCVDMYRTCLDWLVKDIHFYVKETVYLSFLIIITPLRALFLLYADVTDVSESRS